MAEVRVVLFVKDEQLLMQVKPAIAKIGWKFKHEVQEGSKTILTFAKQARGLAISSALTSQLLKQIAVVCTKLERPYYIQSCRMEDEWLSVGIRRRIRY